jgi:hypothetical protein
MSCCLWFPNNAQLEQILSLQSMHMISIGFLWIWQILSGITCYSYIIGCTLETKVYYLWFIDCLSDVAGYSTFFYSFCSSLFFLNFSAIFKRAKFFG